MTHLHRLGQVFHAAPGYRDKQDALDSALRAAQRYRLDGVSWSSVVKALGIPDEELRHRLRETAHKIHHQPEQPAPAPLHITNASGSALGDSPNRSPESQVQYALGSISAPLAQNATVLTAIPSYSTSGRVLSPIGIARRILFVSGDARPGRNDFGSEAAGIRQAVSGAFIEVTEMAAIALPEICQALENYAPAVLHMAAHSSFGGVHLTQDNSRLCIDHTTLSAQIARVRRPPRLAVLNICHSHTLADELTRAVPSVISWSHAINDDQARIFTLQLYRSLANRRSIDDSCKDAEAALAGPHPDCPPPTLHGNTVREPF